MCGFQVILNSIEPANGKVERRTFDQSVGELVGFSAIPLPNRVNESSFSVRAENVCGCDLLSEDDLRAARLDEPEGFGPEVAFVFGSEP